MQIFSTWGTSTCSSRMMVLQRQLGFPQHHLRNEHQCDESMTAAMSRLFRVDFLKDGQTAGGLTQSGVGLHTADDDDVLDNRLLTDSAQTTFEDNDGKKSGE